MDRVLIVGGGIGGLTAAVALAQRGEQEGAGPRPEAARLTADAFEALAAPI